MGSRKQLHVWKKYSEPEDRMFLVDAEKETLSVLDKLFPTVKRRRKFHGELHWQAAYSVLFSVSYSGMPQM